MAEQDNKTVANPPVATLDDLLTLEKAMIIVTLEDGSELSVPIRVPTQWEMLQIAHEVTYPSPPTAGVDPKTKRPFFDFNHPSYIAARESVDMDRNYRTLLAALQLDVPGDTKEEKLTFLKTKFSARITRQLNTAIAVLVGGGQARVAGRAATFLGNGTGNTEDL